MKEAGDGADASFPVTRCSYSLSSPDFSDAESEKIPARVQFLPQGGAEVRISELVESACFRPLLVPAIWQEGQEIYFDDFDEEEIGEMESEQENR